MGRGPVPIPRKGKNALAVALSREVVLGQTKRLMGVVAAIGAAPVSP